MKALFEHLNRHWDDLRQRGRTRSLRISRGLDFCSNDYLGLSRHPALAEALREALDRGLPAGSGGSRLLRGNHPEHEALEDEASRFFGAESALFFGSGYDANLALFSALPTRHDVVVYDERIHASVKEGVRAGFARAIPASHNALEVFETAVVKAREAGARNVFIAVESVYSMDGDRALLEPLLELAQRHDAVLIVDEAHATGIFGARGRGLAEGLRDERLITLHTCGKALGVSGALLAGPAAVTRHLIQSARPLLFSTAPSPLTAALVRRALRLVDEEPERRKKLLFLSCRARRAIRKALSRWTLSGARTQILPLIIGEDARAMAAADFLQSQGFDVRAVRPPTVADGTARLRISVNVDRTDAELAALAHALAEAENHAR